LPCFNFSAERAAEPDFLEQPSKKLFNLCIPLFSLQKIFNNICIGVDYATGNSWVSCAVQFDNKKIKGAAAE
jgi:hypothetical protein